MRAELRQRLYAALVVELAALGGDRSPHNLTRHPQAPRYPSDALAFDQIRTADPAYRLHGHHPGWPPLQPEEASADARVGQLLDADPKPSRSTIPRRSTPRAPCLDDLRHERERRAAGRNQPQQHYRHAV